MVRSKKPTPKSGDRTGYPPSNATRLTINMDKELHRRLKVKAAEDGVTMGSLIEKLALAYLK